MKVKLTHTQAALLRDFPQECNVGTGKNVRLAGGQGWANRSVLALIRKNILMAIERDDEQIGYCLTTLGMDTVKELQYGETA